MTQKRALSFKYALEGIVTALKDQPNLKFQFCVALIILSLGYYFSIPRFEWLILILTIGLVLTLELTNTAIEEVVDSFTDQVHPAAKKAKDVAAGAVLIASITSIAIGLIIFLPYIF